MYMIFFILMIISLIGLITTSLLKLGTIVLVLKILTSVLFVITGLTSYCSNPKNKRYFTFIFLGLIFSLFGDTFLGIDSNGGIVFYIGVLSFAIGHIMYTIGLCKCTKYKIIDFIIFLLIATPIILLVVLGDFDFQGMILVICMYAIIISFMVSKAIALSRIYKENKKAVVLTIAGAIMFLISDIILLVLFFYRVKYDILQQLNWIIYYPGQGLLALSFAYFSDINKISTKEKHNIVDLKMSH